MTNVSEENAQHQTDTHEIHPDGARYGFASYISRRPSWAGAVRIGPEAIDYSWTASLVAESIEPDGEKSFAPVEITREDMLYVNDVGVVLDPGPERIFLLDSTFDVANARLLAAAIVECCDRIDGVSTADTITSNECAR